MKTIEQHTLVRNVPQKLGARTPFGYQTNVDTIRDRNPWPPVSRL